MVLSVIRSRISPAMQSFSAGNFDLIPAALHEVRCLSSWQLMSASSYFDPIPLQPACLLKIYHIRTCVPIHRCMHTGMRGRYTEDRGLSKTYLFSGTPEPKRNTSRLRQVFCNAAGTIICSLSSLIDVLGHKRENNYGTWLCYAECTTSAIG